MNNIREPAGNSSCDFSYHTVLSALRCWWKLVLPLSLVLAIAAASTLLLLHKPQYTSVAWLMITPNRDHLLTPETRTESQRFIHNQIEIMRSPKVLSSLSRVPEILAAPELSQQSDVKQTLAKLLTIEPKGKSDLYLVSFTSESPQKAEIIVKAAVSAFVNSDEQREADRGNMMVELLQLQCDARVAEMNELRTEVRDQSLQTTGIDPFRGGNVEHETSGSQNPFAGLQAEMVRLQVEQDILDARIEVQRHRPAELGAEAPEQEPRGLVSQRQASLDQQALISRLEKKEADFRRTGKNLATSPVFKQVQADLKQQRATLGKLTFELERDAHGALAKQIRIEADARLSKLTEEYDTAAVRLGILEDKFKEGMEAAQQFTGETLDLEFSRAKLQQATAIHDAINQRILQVSTEQRAPKRVTLYEDASYPTKANAYPWKKIGLGTALAFLLPLGICVAWEHFFRRVNSRSQVESLQQLSLIGEITAYPTRGRQSAFRGRAAQRDVKLFEESIDSLRTYLSLSEPASALGVIAVVSAVSGEGKTSLAAQIAVCISRATREPTLLIDGDLRSPDIHNIFEIEVGPGLAKVLQHECELKDAIDASNSAGLHILPAGQLGTSPHGLMGGGAFAKLLQSLKTTYRYIIIDTPPVLAAGESLVLARAADTSIFCIRRDFSCLGQSQAAHARMLAAGVHVSGAVLNCIPTRQYVNHYGSDEVSPSSHNHNSRLHPLSALARATRTTSAGEAPPAFRRLRGSRTVSVMVGILVVFGLLSGALYQFRAWAGGRTPAALRQQADRLEQRTHRFDVAEHVAK